MKRRPFQVLVFPFLKIEQSNYQYCIFKRADESYWQSIAGGGENSVTLLQAAKREVIEESGIYAALAQYFKLDTISSVPTYFFAGRQNWNPNQYVIPNYCFAVEVFNRDITLSTEHSEYQWVSYQEANKLLHWDDNKTALWELNARLINKNLPSFQETLAACKQSAAKYSSVMGESADS